MRVALVTPDLRPATGGPAENVPRLASALAAEGLCVEVHTIGPAPEPTGPAQYFLSRPAIPRRLGRSPEMKRRLLASGADIVHASCLWMLPLRYAADAAGAGGKPLVISPRGMLSPWAMNRSRWKKALARRFVHPGALSCAAGWHATSPQEESDIRKLGFTQPVCVAPNGIEPPVDDPALTRATYLRAAPALTDRRVLLFYSRFHSKKRIKELMRDFVWLSVHRPEWHLLAVGIPEEYSVEGLRAEAAHLGIQDRVTVLDGRSLPKPYPLAEILAFPTHEENFGRVVAEALANGVPVLTTSRTPWAKLDELDAGRCVDLEAARDALEEMMGRSRLALQSAGQRGRNWVLAEFDWRTTACRLAAFYGQLLNAPRASL